MKLKNFKENLTNKIKQSKTKEFVEEHKRSILEYSIIVGVSALTGVALGKYANHLANRQASVEVKLSQLEFAAAAEKVVGHEQTGKIIDQALVNKQNIDKYLAGMSYKEIDKMINNAVKEGAVKVQELPKI